MSKRKRLSFKDKVKACELYDQGYDSQEIEKDANEFADRL